ncbi:polyhydroxyalkanoate synthesis repressor PhaR [Lampropedia puyangensis]|uniref:Polyhydroxyalkanoate synthesis repressor PhaR n=1 Tax=Lampropedia puyangensis TaxID=1330072 RepID=A0A4S8EXH4_9BURK|nr:polyhydroxyalkanoate synthesis repressor PhaR [Lampropedia puyangensis]THT99609.1 polyhydroxyalkanoate synthesis repressor PhaR [Lampropedia puyangensis]
MVTRKKAEADDSHFNGRVIKKYPNRRLYDLAHSTYITLADVKQLVIDRQPVIVVDAKTGENLTRSILLQIILEEEVGGTPIFSEAVLANLIRFYGHTMQGFMGAYIEKNIQAMAEMQSQWAEQTRQMPPEFWGQFQAFSQPVMPAMMGGFNAEQSRQTLAKAQEQMQEQVRQQTEQFLQLFGIKNTK